MVFCNDLQDNYWNNKACHNPYFNRWFSAIYRPTKQKPSYREVTILILIDGFLQFLLLLFIHLCLRCHNPYFNRWFSAIKNTDSLFLRIYSVTILILIDGFLQYIIINWSFKVDEVTILILIDGFLQFKLVFLSWFDSTSHNPYFNRWFSAIPR